jgi:hypothetical protein
MIEMGVIVGLGLLVSLVKMNWKWRMHVLSNPLMMDAIIFMALLLVHWGTFSGVMVATIGALTCSLTISGGRWLYGSVESGVYQPGYFNVASRLS